MHSGIWIRLALNWALLSAFSLAYGQMMFSSSRRDLGMWIRQTLTFSLLSAIVLTCGQKMPRPSRRDSGMWIRRAIGWAALSAMALTYGETMFRLMPYEQALPYYYTMVVFVLGSGAFSIWVVATEN